MTDDELTRYLKERPEAMTVPLPGGWNRIDTVPLAARALDFLRDDGSVLDYGSGPSNAEFICESRAYIGWRPWPLDRVKDRERRRFEGRVNAAEMAEIMGDIERRFERRGWY